MPRRVSKKCVECARLSAPMAQQLHGPEGDGCWVESRCRRRRSHYRNRLAVNEKRRSAYREGENTPAQKAVEEVSLAVEEEVTPYATLYIWREKRKDAPVHAISASVFQGSSKVLEIKPIHCAGFRRRSLEKYVQKDVMGYLKARFGITFFANEVRLEPIECPLAGCPLNDRSVTDREQPFASIKVEAG